MTISDPLRVAVVGLGYGSAVAREARKEPAFELVCVCDSDADRARACGEAQNVPWTTSYESVLGDGRVEAVLVYTPPHLHAEHIRMAAEAGKGVRVTKPLERSARKAQEALDFARSRGVAVIVDSPPPRYTGLYGIAREIIGGGEIGEVVSASTFTGAWYDNIDPDGTWYDDNDLCPGGPLYRLGIYGVNFLNVTLGEPVEVSAAEAHMRSRRPTPDTGALTLKYRSGALAQVVNSLSWRGTAYPDTTLLQGTRGMLLFNPDFIDCHTASPQAILRTESGVRAICAPCPSTAPKDADYFARLVREGGAPEIPLSHAVDGVRVMEALVLALREKRTVCVQ